MTPLDIKREENRQATIDQLKEITADSLPTAEQVQAARHAARLLETRE